MDPTWRGVNLICRLADPSDPVAAVTLTRQPVPTMRRDLLELFDRSELGKYYTPAELSVLDNPTAADGSREDHP
jgi:succinate dehydrogenase / fumarate reductase flavoprotein subunit